MEQVKQYLSTLDELIGESPKDENSIYKHPAMKKAGTVSIILLREVIAPLVIKNSEEEVTDIDWQDEAYIRAVPNKFKYTERGRGLQILRYLKCGGTQAQNKTFILKSQNPSDVFDMNTLIYGDSTNSQQVLPIKAAVNYSDAISLKPKEFCVGETFHNRAAEDGTLWDAENKKNSDNIFNRHYVMPGTLLVQVLTTRGRVLPPEAMDHLLLSIGFAGAYGGQTSITGTNVKTHFVGAYGDLFEREISSPYILNQLFKDFEGDLNAERASEMIHSAAKAQHKVSLNSNEVTDYVDSLMKRFENDQLSSQYQNAAKKIGNLFNSWFNKEEAA